MHNTSTSPPLAHPYPTRPFCVPTLFVPSLRLRHHDYFRQPKASEMRQSNTSPTSLPRKSPRPETPHPAHKLSTTTPSKTRSGGEGLPPPVRPRVRPGCTFAHGKARFPSAASPPILFLPCLIRLRNRTRRTWGRAVGLVVTRCVHARAKGMLHPVLWERGAQGRGHRPQGLVRARRLGRRFFPTSENDIQTNWGSQPQGGRYRP